MSDESTQTTIGEGGTSSPDSAVQLETAQNEIAVEGQETASVQQDAAVTEPQDAQPLNEFQLTYDFEDFEADIDSKLEAAEQDEKAPEFYRHALKEYKKYANQFRESQAPFSEVLGVVPEADLPDSLELIKALHTVHIRDGQPQVDTGRVSELLIQKHGTLVPELIKALGTQQAPGSKYNYFATALKQQYGIEPDQLEAVKSYIENQTIPQVPEEFTKAYRALSPKVKEELPYMNEQAQLEILQNKQAELDRQEQSTRQVTEQQQRDQTTIESTAENTYIERTNSVMTALVNALSKAQFSSDPKVNALIAQQNAHMAYNAINPYSAGYNMAKTALKDIGVEIDEARVNNILDRMSESCRLAAYHRHYNNQTEAQKYDAQIARHEQELLAQVNKAAAGLLKVRGQGVTAQVANQESAIAQTNGRPIIQGTGGQGNDNTWLGKLAPVGSEERYQQIAELAAAGKN